MGPRVGMLAFASALKAKAAFALAVYVSGMPWSHTAYVHIHIEYKTNLSCNKQIVSSGIEFRRLSNYIEVTGIILLLYECQETCIGRLSVRYALLT